MESVGIPLEEVYRFADPQYWIEYFPPFAKQDLMGLGCHVDWRRSFVTTDVNPFYDSFVRWQFNKLLKLDRVKFGKRHTIFSPKDGQACLDHDRQSGEGVEPKEYTCIKMELVGGLQDHPSKRVFLVAATLRPETMYGQTNCWVGPDIEYGIFEHGNNELFVCTDRSARNMSYQDEFGEPHGHYRSVGVIKGTALLGRKVKAPLSVYQEVYVLPMLSITASKGTGIVTSVPSNSPDDYAALNDLVEKEAFRQKYGLADDMVLPFKPVPIIETSGLGSMSAAFLVKEHKIKSQNDRDALEKAKAIAYKEDFYAGKMTVGPHAGTSVADAKSIIREELIKTGEAISYYEPENVVMSRSGDECVVALIDQWYLDYGTPDWRADAEKCVARMNFYCPEIRNQFEATLAWMRQWACSRSFGLGTKIPWDPKYLVESLSDSTIYMAYYTVAHILHEGSFDGSVQPCSITPEQMTDEVWEYVFGETGMPETAIPVTLMERMRKEFRFFYPLDLRVSGKDLVPNHLTMSIYNHVALFPEPFWPRSFRANGHLLLNSEKMSKSTGNFMTIADALNEFGADASRLALADAGDSVEDANFLKDTANMAVLRLFNLLEFAKDVANPASNYREGPSDQIYPDLVFAAEINRAIVLAREAYQQMLYREVVKVAFFELQNARDRYRDVTVTHGTVGMNRDLLKRFFEVQSQIMSPIIPHFAEHVWMTVLGHPESILNVPWPAPQPIDEGLLASAAYLHDLAHQMRTSLNADTARAAKKGKAAPTDIPNTAEVYVVKNFPKWQEEVIEILRSHYDASSQSMTIPDDKIVALIKPIMGTITDKSILKKVIPFVMELKAKLVAEGPKILNRALAFDEAAVLAQNMDYITKSIGLISIEVKTDASINDEETAKKFEASIPGAPAVRFTKN